MTPVERAVHASVARLGPPKLLVASAGMVVPGPFDDLPLAAFRETMEVNHFGALNLVRAACRHCGRSAAGASC